MATFACSKRAKALGDYLMNGITADGFDKLRGKINVQQSLMERIEAVRSTGLADQIIVEEYEGQKIDDIRRYNVDIFAIGSDWNGHFDYLKRLLSGGLSGTHRRRIRLEIAPRNTNCVWAWSAKQ